MHHKTRLVYISAVATPQQIRFCEALQEYFDAEFWFFENPERTRGAFWKIKMGPKCKVLKQVWFTRPGFLEGRHYSPLITGMLADYDPDIVMIGGFSKPGSFVAYRWAKKHNRKTIVFTERSRDCSGTLRKRSPVWRLIRRLYRDVDMVMVSAEDIVPQFRDIFGFGEKVVAGRYASDLDGYLGHPLRQAKSGYAYLFANRLTEIYNPIGAIDIFQQVVSRYPESRLLMNAHGELADQCRIHIDRLGLAESVEFLTGLEHWDDLKEVYARSDILLFPAKFSNGNFTILEAMASGMGLVISDRILGIGKMVRDGYNGFRCEPSIEAFVERIEYYINDPALFQVHTKNNRPMVEPLGAKGTARFFHKVVNEFFTEDVNGKGR